MRVVLQNDHIQLSAVQQYAAFQTLQRKVSDLNSPI